MTRWQLLNIQALELLTFLLPFFNLYLFIYFCCGPFLKSLFNLLQNYFCFTFFGFFCGGQGGGEWLAVQLAGLYFPDQGLNPGLWALAVKVPSPNH